MSRRGAPRQSVASMRGGMARRPDAPTRYYVRPISLNWYYIRRIPFALRALRPTYSTCTAAYVLLACVSSHLIQQTPECPEVRGRESALVDARVCSS